MIIKAHTRAFGNIRACSVEVGAQQGHGLAALPLDCLDRLVVAKA
jgi:hypothetical protein